jgi:hypothetical protein
MRWVRTRFPNIEANEEGQLRGAKGVIAGWVRPDGYRTTTANVNGRKKLVWFHKTICEAFHGPKPTPSYHAAHLDGNKLNNKADNLKWKTPAENEKDKERHGTKLFGERANGAKLTRDKVLEIRQAYENGGVSQQRLAERYGVCQRTINMVVRRITWTK